METNETDYGKKRQTSSGQATKSKARMNLLGGISFFEDRRLA
jgi:hypothetical protein